MMRRLMGENASEVPFVSVLRIRIPRFSFVNGKDGDLSRMVRNLVILALFIAERIRITESNYVRGRTPAEKLSRNILYKDKKAMI